MFRPLYTPSPLSCYAALRHLSNTMPKRLKCTLTMYTLQGKHTAAKHCVFTASTVHRMRDIVCDFLKVSSVEDRRFVDSIFTNKVFRWFELISNTSPQVYGILVSGAQRMAFSDQEISFPKVPKSCSKIRMTFQNLIQEEDVILTAKQIEEREASDPILAAFAYSDSFSSYSEVSHTCDTKRILEKDP